MYSHTARNPGGAIITTDVSGNTVQQDTKQCCHCGNHWIVQPGSGRIRGYCFLCDGHHCGEPSCHECIPFEKRMDLYEKGKLVNSAGQPDLMGNTII